MIKCYQCRKQVLMSDDKYNGEKFLGVVSATQCPHCNPSRESPTMKIEFPSQSSQCLYCGHTLPSHYSFCSLAFPPMSFQTTPDKPKTEVLSPGVDQVPFEGIEAIGAIFAEGEKKYGKDNWKSAPSDAEYNAERTRHAIRHLFLWANGDRSEPHLAKVAWFCVTTIWREKQA